MSQTMTPLVSVVMLSYDYARFIGKAIESVLAQTYAHFELIVVDDGSRDESAEVLAHYQDLSPEQLRVFGHPEGAHLGIVRSLQLGLSNVRGEIVAFLDADDYWHRANLEKKVSAFTAHPEAGVVASRYRPFGLRRASLYWRLYEWANRFSISFRRPVDGFPVFLRRNAAASFSNFAVRRYLLRDIPFSFALERNFDWWLLGHLSLKTKFCFLPEKLTFWRIHAGSAGYGKASRIALGRLYCFLKEYYESLREILLRTREDEKEKEKRLIDGAIAFLEKIRESRRSVFPRILMTSPVEALKFIGFIILRNLLF